MAESVFLEDPDCPTLVGNSIKIVNYGIGKRNRILGHFRRLFWARNYAIVTIVSENSSFSLWIWNSLEKKLRNSLKSFCFS